MIQHIDFSPGQVKILARVCEIYNENLGEVYRNLNTNGPTVMEAEVLDELGVQVSSLFEYLENDLIRFSEIQENPQLLIRLNPFEIIICGFIIREWQKQEKWNDLEVANLLNKLMILSDIQSSTNQINLS